MRPLWVGSLHDAFVYMADPIVKSEADRKTTP
jgi:hypothetical protein